MTKKTSSALLIALLLSMVFSCTNSPETIRIAVSTDVHGMIFPEDLIERRPASNSLSHVYSYLLEKRQSKDTALLLLDNGDFLQGQPSVYYYNFLETAAPHICTEVMNFMQYDAGTVGNHDIEAGPEVYRRLEENFQFPWLAANAVNSISGEPEFIPYTILEAGRKKIAVLGLITPGIPSWLPEEYWLGMEFKDMVETAAFWVPRILEDEKPDLLVGLFHSGLDKSYGGAENDYLNENASLLVAEQVPGFDLIFAGHDHRNSVQWVQNIAGDSVLLIDPGSHARFIGEAQVTFLGDQITMEAQNIPMHNYKASNIFLEKFNPHREELRHYLDDTITWLSEEMKGLDGLFGPGPRISLVHRLQLELSGADISFCAPLSINTSLYKGPVLVSDLFKLYKFENILYRLEMTGNEIDAYLEYAVGPWFETMKSRDDHLLKFSSSNSDRLANPYYNFSSAAGILYTVDVTKKVGDRVEIQSMADGTDFYPDHIYQVAVNSYRRNGGGGHLSKGAGLDRETIEERSRWFSERDIRFHLMEYLDATDTLYINTLDNWSVIPEEYTTKASLKDRSILEKAYARYN